MNIDKYIKTNSFISNRGGRAASLQMSISGSQSEIDALQKAIYAAMHDITNTPEKLQVPVPPEPANINGDA